MVDVCASFAVRDMLWRMTNPPAARSLPDDPHWVTTGPAARALGVHVNTLWRWQREGLVHPASRTARGHARWDLEDLRRQVDEVIKKHDHERELVTEARRHRGTDK